jgi:hypothetical protein
MITRISIISILFTILVSCADKEEAQKYALLAQENSKLMSMCDYISNDKQSFIDSLQKIQKDYGSGHSSSDSSLAIANEIIDAIEARDNVIKLKSKLDNQVLNYILLEKANEKFFYLTRHAVINKYTDELFFINKEIIDITGELMTKAYLNKYLPPSMQLQ